MDPSPAIDFDSAYANLERDASSLPRDQVLQESAKRVYEQFTSFIDPEERRRIWDTDPIFDADMTPVRREDYLRYRRWAELEIKAANDAIQECKFRLWDEQIETKRWREMAEQLIRIHMPSLKHRDMTFEQVQQHTQQLRQSRDINEPTAEGAPRRGEKFDPDRPIAIPAERMPSLWDNHQDKLVQHAVETSLISAALMQRVKNFRNMQLRAEKAEEAARKLGYAPLVARCLFYRGVAQVGMEQGFEARQTFLEAEPCIGHYEEGKWVRAWAAHSTGLTPTPTSATGGFSDMEDLPRSHNEAR